MCNCLIVLKPLVKEYGGKLLGSFFMGSSDGPSASKFGGKILSKDRWKNNSYQLGSIDKSIHNTGAVAGGNKIIGKKDDIFITSTFTVEGASDDEQSKSMRDFDTESQEDIIKRVKKYSK
jgi:hypothetical protein